MNLIQRILVVVAVLQSVQAQVDVMPLRFLQPQNNLAPRNREIILSPGPPAIGTGVYGEISTDRPYYNGYDQRPDANTNYGHNTQANAPVWNTIVVPAHLVTQNPSKGIIIQTGPQGQLIISYIANNNPSTSTFGNQQQTSAISDVNIQGQLKNNENAGNQISKNNLPKILSSKQSGNNVPLNNGPKSSLQGKQDQSAVNILLDQQTIRKSAQTAIPDEQTVRDSLPTDPPDQQTRSTSLKLSQLSPATSARGPVDMQNRFGNVEMQSTLQQLGSGLGGIFGSSAGGSLGGAAGGIIGGGLLGIAGGAVGGLTGSTIGGLAAAPVGAAVGGTIGGIAGGGVGTVVATPIGGVAGGLIGGAAGAGIGELVAGPPGAVVGGAIGGLAGVGIGGIVAAPIGAAIGGAIGGLGGGGVGGIVASTIGATAGGTVGGAVGGGIGGGIGGQVGGTIGGGLVAPIGHKVGSVFGAGSGAGVGAVIDQFRRELGPNEPREVNRFGHANGAYGKR